MRDAVLLGDARDVLATLDDASIDAIVTDPPYALTQVSRGGSWRTNDPSKPHGRHCLADKGFMGQQWDNGTVVHDPAFWAEVLRVAKPGAFLLAFGGTRTYHRLACAIEDAGWECRDMLNWLQGSGFPKSKSCLKPSHEPIVLAKAPGPLQPLQIDACRLPTDVGDETGRPKGSHGAFPFSDDAFGNGPLTYAGGHAGGRWPPNTLLSHHPECRPAGVRRVRGSGDPARFQTTTGGWASAAYGNQLVGSYTDADGYETVDAWTCVDGCPVAELDRQAGPRTSGANHVSHNKPTPGWRVKGTATGHWPANTGSASRFFPTFGPDPQDAVPFRYQPKASRAERNAGLEGMPAAAIEVAVLDGDRRRCRRCGKWYPKPMRLERRPASTCICREPDFETLAARPSSNGHPTVKPLGLMSWLCKLVTPQGGTVLDCFAGSGSTGVACVREGFGFIGIEQSAEYVAIARARIAHEQEQRSGPLFAGVGTAAASG